MIKDTRITQDPFPQAQFGEQEFDNKFRVAEKRKDAHDLHQVSGLKYSMYFLRSFIRIFKAVIVNNSRRACESQPGACSRMSHMSYFDLIGLKFRSYTLTSEANTLAVLLESTLC